MPLEGELGYEGNVVDYIKVKGIHPSREFYFFPLWLYAGVY